MKIIRLEAKGFRSLKDICWEPDALNIVIGPNGTGKSNLLRLLELISISAGGGLGKYVQSWGGMETLIWDGRLEGIDFKIKMSPVEDYRDVEKESLTYELSLKRLGKTSSYKIVSEQLANYYSVESGKRSDPFKLIYRTATRGLVFDEEERSLLAPEGSLSEEETLLSTAIGPFSHNRHIPPFRSQLTHWHVYHDLHVNRDAAIRQPVIARLEKTVQPDGQNLISVLHTLYTGDRDFEKEINTAMEAAFGDDYEGLIFPPAADQRIQLRVRWKSLQREQSTAELPDGMLRFLFLLTVLASPSPAAVIAIDEPETGLHPSMLPLVAEYAIDASSRAQVILTTHSPQLLDAFHDTKPVATVTKWNNGVTQLKKLVGEELEYWLKEYSLGALFKSGELEDME
jgi:predicted ATPase